MPFKVSKFAQHITNQASVKIDDDEGESFTIDYKPGAITTRMVRRAQSAKDATVMADILETIITDWQDLEDDAGNPVPYTPDALEDFGLEALVYIFNKMYEGVSMGEGNGASKLTPSESPSLPKAKPGSSRR